jgi:hypothetical protein
MPERRINAEKALEQLGKRVRVGWARLHPVMPNELAVVHEVVRKQWELDHGPAAKADHDKSQKLPPQKTQDKDWGHSH